MSIRRGPGHYQNWGKCRNCKDRRSLALFGWVALGAPGHVSTAPLNFQGTGLYLGPSSVLPAGRAVWGYREPLLAMPGALLRPGPVGRLGVGDEVLEMMMK